MKRLLKLSQWVTFYRLPSREFRILGVSRRRRRPRTISAWLGIHRRFLYLRFPAPTQEGKGTPGSVVVLKRIFKETFFVRYLQFSSYSVRKCLITMPSCRRKDFCHLKTFRGCRWWLLTGGALFSSKRLFSSLTPFGVPPVVTKIIFLDLSPSNRIC